MAGLPKEGRAQAKVPGLRGVLPIEGDPMTSVASRSFPSSLQSLAAILGLIALLIASSSRAHSLATATPSATTTAEAHAKTQALISLANRYAAAITIDKPRLRNDLLQAAHARL